MGRRKGFAIFKNAMFYSVLLFVAVVAVIVIGVRNVGETVADEQLTMLENAVRRSAVQCYALEGSYPVNLDYLKDEYGLYFDEETYVVHYLNIGGNLLPEISVFYIEN